MSSMNYVKTEVPTDDEVVEALRSFNGPVTAYELFEKLYKNHQNRSDCQLAIQRAEERGRIEFLKDWKLQVVEEELEAA